MHFNSDRLLVLSGITAREDYQDKLLRENRIHEMQASIVLEPETAEEVELTAELGLDPEVVEVEPSASAVAGAGHGGEETPEAGMEEPEAAAAPPEEMPDEEPVAEELPPEELEEAYEAKLRLAIRKEVESIMAEVLATKEEAQIQQGIKNKNVGVAMGFAGPGFGSPRNTRNRAVSRGPGGTIGFGGPGFM